jgi:peptidoglycan/xylan/chitin deacetylase (PgdA/CDA1 family)
LKIAVTFDDVPLGGPSLPIERMEAVNDALVGSLKNAGVPAVGFVNESKLYQDREVDRRIALLKAWLDAGLELGNHSFSHPSLHHVPVDEWLEDVARGETVTRMLLAQRDRQLRFFRHPFLRTGLTQDVKEAAESALAARGYTVAPVTIENWDYLYNVLYSDAKSRADTAGMKQVAQDYLDFTEAMFEFFEGASRQLLGRQIRHVLLLHANEINAGIMGDLLELARARGYEFVTLDEALRDEAYGFEDGYAGPAGVSWIFRWDYTRAHAAGEPLTIDWRAEPEPPAEIQARFQEIRQRQ